MFGRRRLIKLLALTLLAGIISRASVEGKEVTQETIELKTGKKYLIIVNKENGFISKEASFRSARAYYRKGNRRYHLCEL